MPRRKKTQSADSEELTGDSELTEIQGFADDLATLQDMPAEEFKRRSSQFFQAWLGASLKSVPPARSIKEIATLADLWGKFSGQFGKGKEDGGGMVRAMPSVTRSPVVEVPPEEFEI